MDENPYDLPPGMPEELKQAIIAHHMKNDQISHEIAAFFEELNEEQLRILKGVISMLTYADNPVATGTYYIGLMVGILNQKFKLCLGCAGKHDEEAHKMYEDAQAEKLEHPLHMADQVKLIPEEEAAQMLTYGVSVLKSQYPALICNGCGAIFINLEDRMLRPPGVKGCETCKQNQKWGGPHLDE